MKRLLVFLCAIVLIFGLAGMESHAETFTLVKTIDLDSVLETGGSIEVDVVGDELYMANYFQNKYFIIDPVTENLIGSFFLSDGINIDNHGSEYNPTTGRILHAGDDDIGGLLGDLGYDAFFETDITGNLERGPYDLFGTDDNSEDPEGLTVDPVTGRIWVSDWSISGGITEINPIDGTILHYLDVGVAWALGFNPNSGNLFFADGTGVIYEVAPDGTGLAMVFDLSTMVLGMAFTPTGDLAILDYHGYDASDQKLLLYDSDYDADNAFTTSPPVPPPPITISSPNGGEELLAGATHDITWTSTGDITSVTIEYSVDNGVSWTEIAASTANDGLYEWEVPDAPSGGCLVRVSDDIDDGPFDVSDTVFAIIPDEDGDGVPDDEDDCHETPQGSCVNEYGCPSIYTQEELDEAVADAEAAKDAIIDGLNEQIASMYTQAELDTAYQEGYDEGKIIGYADGYVEGLLANKVTICHRPGGANRTKRISRFLLKWHLRHGDTIGECN